MNEPFVYGDGLQIVIPEDAVRVTVLMRHSDSVQEGVDKQRTLKRPRGVELCNDIKPELDALTKFLSSQFGEPVFFHSGWPRSTLTLFLATGAEQIIEHTRLASKISSRDFPHLGEPEEPRFLGAHATAMGWTKQQTLAAMAATLRKHYHGDVMAIDDFHRVLLDSRDFITGQYAALRHMMAVGHENAISLTAALAGAPDDQLGLKWCQAFVFFVDAEGAIIGVQKFTPTATLNLPDE